MDAMLFLQFQACFLWLVLSAGWTLSGLARRRERLRRLRLASETNHSIPHPAPAPDAVPAFSGATGPSTATASGAKSCAATAPPSSPQMPLATSSHTHQLPRPLPPVCVVMPVKGCRSHSLDNWESHLSVSYDGPIEFLFVVEAATDPAVPQMEELLAGRGWGQRWGQHAMGQQEGQQGGRQAGRQAGQQAMGPLPEGMQQQQQQQRHDAMERQQQQQRQGVEEQGGTERRCGSGQGLGREEGVGEQRCWEAGSQPHAGPRQQAQDNGSNGGSCACVDSSGGGGCSGGVRKGGAASSGVLKHSCKRQHVHACDSHARNGNGDSGIKGNDCSSKSCAGVSSSSSCYCGCCCNGSSSGNCGSGHCSSGIVCRPAGVAASRAARVIVAGLSERCSQKIHNLCAGIQAADPRVTSQAGYVLCLDDDVALHPGSVRELVEEMEAKPELFMATGYPFDIPPPGSSLPAYLALSYHLPLLVAFSVVPDGAFVWGGCMLLRGRQLAPGDPGGLLAAWRDGGYSDDMICSSYCSERRLRIRVPPFAIFPQRLDPRMTWRSWLNYLHRQLFVLDTYTNRHNRIANHTLMLVHSALSWLLVLPSLAALAQCGCYLLTLLASFPSHPHPGLHAHAGSQQQPLQLQHLLPAQPRPLTMTTNPLTLGITGGSGDGSGSGGSGGSGGGSGAGGLGVPAVLAGWAAAHAALVFMAAEVLSLFRQLSPAAPRVPLHWFRWGRLWAALLLSNAALPLLMAYTYMSAMVEWGGVQYRKHRGRVKPVRRAASHF